MSLMGTQAGISPDSRNGVDGSAFFKEAQAKRRHREVNAIPSTIPADCLNSAFKLLCNLDVFSCILKNLSVIGSRLQNPHYNMIAY